MKHTSFFLVTVFCYVLLMLPASSAKKSRVEVINEKDKTRHVDCHSLMIAGYNVSGVYRLHMHENDTGVLLPCEFRDGNAFTVILQRVDRIVSFIETWQRYESGFGHPQSDFWAGLSRIYSLTQQGNNKLQINMQDWAGVSKNGFYTHFALESRDTRYRLHVYGYQGTLVDDLSYNNNMPFSTYDAPDPYGCAAGMKAGWWYNYCSYFLPTGIHYAGHYTPTGTMYDGIFWKDWHDFNYSLKYVSMLLSH